MQESLDLIKRQRFYSSSCLFRRRFYHSLAFATSLFLAACASPTDTLIEQGFELEGPTGLVEREGPWLIRVALVEGVALDRLRLGYSLSLSNQGSAEDQGFEGQVMSLDLERSVELLESARPDTAFALLPSVNVGQEISYALFLDKQRETKVYSLKLKSPQVASESERSSTPQCEVYLESPDPKRPLNSAQDQAPEAGLQLRFSARVFPQQNGMVDLDGGNSLSGLMTFEWLAAAEEREVLDGTIATISGGLARSAPFTSRLGEQKLLISAYTSRSGQCEQVVRFSSD